MATWLWIIIVLAVLLLVRRLWLRATLVRKRERERTEEGLGSARSSS